MIRSMTAFARYDIKSEWGSATWEIRSINHRYLEIYLRFPEHLRSLESVIRERMRSRLTRGKVECYLRFELNSSNISELILNKNLACQIIRAANVIKKYSNEGEINPLEILRWPGVMSPVQQDLDIIRVELLSSFDKTLDNFIKIRETEGAVLYLLIEQRLNAVLVEVTKVRQYMPEILQWQRNRLKSKLEEAGVQIENHRLEQELLILIHRADVAEELDRLEAHIQVTRNILKKKDANGRRLDFMMQECNRESNTLASKSIHSEIINSAVELKVLIEQMREQIQNIE
ncbi:hypothetical protein GFV14_00144 [Candidatus Hartigia pinicola]|nr:hypothetical protein GFV14_00144 [Candidatus Hartigia pinicola]